MLVRESLEHHRFVRAEERLPRRRWRAQVRRHADLGHGDAVRGERVVMHVAAHQHFGQRMAHLLAHAQHADGLDPPGFRCGACVSLFRLLGPGGGSPPAHPSHLAGAGALFDLERLEGVARLDVGRALERDAALQAGAHLGHIVLEAAQRGDRRRCR